MRYRTFTGKNKQEAYALLNTEKKYDPTLKEARLIKDTEEKVSSFMGLKQQTIYKIVIGIPEHTSFIEDDKKIRNFPKPLISKDNGFNNIFSSIEKNIIRQKATTVSKKAVDDNLFTIKNTAKVTEQISRLEQILPKREYSSQTNTKNKIIKETELKKELANIRSDFKELANILTSQQKNINNSQLINILQEGRELPNEYEIHQQHLRWIDRYLSEREFSHKIIEDIISSLEKSPEILTDKNNILVAVEKFLQKNIPITNISLDHYKYEHDIIFVGPTGVGKTSTILKLAAHLSLMRKKTFRFISIDRYKVGGETQLEKMAGYMNTQFHAINKQEDFFMLMNEKKLDFTFIDTAGKGPKETIAIQELAHWISMIGKPIDTHLVVSATTKVSDLDYICDTYSILNYNHILVTKLDETKTLGSIISLSYKYRKPFSFITDGQEIPQDFEIADTHRLIKESLQ